MAQISVVIPTWGKKRAENVKKLLVDLQGQSVKPAQVEVVRQVAPNGRARNVGAARTSGEILVFLDDDVRLGHPGVLEALVVALQSPDFGMVGTAQQLPPESSSFQRSVANQLSRSQSAVVAKYEESDMVTTQCCAVRREVFERLGGFHEGLLRGVDPEFRDRVRRAGLRIVVVPEAWHYHPAPASLRELLSMAYRDGYSSAQVFRQYPEAVLFNPEGHVGQFQARRPTLWRYVGRALKLLKEVGRGRFLGALYSLSYILGYARAFTCPLRAPGSGRAAGVGP